MSRNVEEPPKTGPAGAPRWADYLDWVRGEMIRGVLDLTPEQQRTARVPSGWTPLELLSHALHMEQRWFVWGFLGEPVEEPFGDWDVDNPGEDTPDARWQVPADATAESYAERLEAIGERTREVLASYPLDARGAVGGRFTSDPPTLEWICFHVLAEYARHAGHLDIVVELGRSGD
ncbi:Mini-circle protein [Nocardioides silvaticus]|uniref:Mini-circle protein n=1 Tax=Nocardioides silvaticus TaxID=2201891 RepID=A0A316TRY0_9ACTN|nr:Mini-circle protein [Nocardioides silvaticus]